MDQSDRRPTVLCVWNEMTPYHVHALKRMHSDAPDIRVVHVMTHSLYDNSMPWSIEVPPGIDIRFDPRNRIPGARYIHWRLPALMRFIGRVVDETNPIFVLLAGHSDACRWLLIPMLKRRGIPIAHWSDSNVFGLSRGSRVVDALRLAYLRVIMRRMDAFMPMGTCGRAYYRLVGGPGKPMFLRPYEPDYEFIASKDDEAVSSFRSRHGLASGRRVFLYSGRLAPVKCVDLLIRAFVRMADDAPDWDLLIAGGGPMLESLTSLVPEHMRHRVRFTGFLQMNDVKACYHCADALVHPSRYEPWALVINESVAAGLAVVATYVTGAAVELVRHKVNGYLIAPDSSDEIEIALRHVARPGECERLRSNASRMLSEWRRSADPIDGLRAAVRYFEARKRMAGRDGY